MNKKTCAQIGSEFHQMYIALLHHLYKNESAACGTDKMGVRLQSIYRASTFFLLPQVH